MTVLSAMIAAAELAGFGGLMIIVFIIAASYAGHHKVKRGKVPRYDAPRYHVKSEPPPKPQPVERHIPSKEYVPQPNDEERAWLVLEMFEKGRNR